MEKRLIHFFVFIFSFIQIRSKNQIILKPGLKISSFFKNFTGDLLFPIPDEITMFETDKYYTDNSAIIDYSYEFKLPMYVNSSTEVLGYNLNVMKHNFTPIIRGANYLLKMNYPASLVTNYPKNYKYSNPMNSSYALEIVYNAPSLEFNRKYFKDIVIDKANSFHNLIFGITKGEKNNFFIYEYEMSKFTNKRLSDYVTLPFDIKLEDKIIESLHLYETIQKDISFLVLKCGSSLYVFKLVKVVINNIIDVKISFNNVITHISLTPMIIEKIICKDDYTFVGEKHGMIQIYDKKGKLVKNINHFPVNNTFENLYLQDMVIINNTIYVISEDYGIKIINITDIPNSDFTNFDFYHPYLRKLDVHRNPYRDFTYVGVLVSDRYFEDGNEFFFELKVLDEFYPILNRYYLDSEFLDINYFISDNKFSYIYEHFSNSIYFLVRSNVINEYDSVFKIQIPELHNKRVNQEIFFIKNKNDGSQMIGILAENELTIIENIYFSNASFQIKFKEYGKYVFDFVTNVDYCEGTKDKIYEYPDNVYYCSVSLVYEFDVNRNSGNQYVNVIYSNYTLLYIFMFSVLIIFVLLAFFCYKKLLPYIINLMRVHKYTDQVEDLPKVGENEKRVETENNQIDFVPTEGKV